MSYPNQDATLHQIHLDNKVMNHDCELCWHEPISKYIKTDPIFDALLAFQENHINLLKNGLL